jgi:hypothetical protein
MGGGAAGRERLRGHLLRQAGWCDELGSPLSALLARAAADDVAAGGPVWHVLAPYAHLPGTDAIALRLLAGVHRLVLSRRAPALALHYPSAGGTAGLAGAGGAFLAAVAEHADELRALVARPLQTNEVARCAALLGGFLQVARATGLPLRLLEIGASAGLNLRWDRYRYEQRDREWSWGEAGAALTLAGLWSAPPLPEPPAVTVVERRGCDRAPVDPTTVEGRLTLTAAVWPDQRARHERLRGALAVAATVPAQVDAEDAATWVPAALGEPVPGTATVLYQSVVDQYLTPDARAAVAEAVEDAGARATPAAPLAWLRLEPGPGGSRLPIDLRTWPGGVGRRIGTSSPHGTDVVAG